MKKLLLTLILVMSVGFGLFAQQLTYQAVIRDASQQLVVNTEVATHLTLHFTDGSSDYDTTVYSTTNIHGLLTFLFGNRSLYTRNWENATITTTVMNNADNSIVYINNLPRPITAVPFALSVNGQSIQNYLDEHNYIADDSVRQIISDTANALRATIGTGGGVADCNAVNACVATALGDNTSALNQAIDTIANNVATNVTSNYLTTNNYVNTNTLDNRHYLTSDSTVITTMQSSISTLQTEVNGANTHINALTFDSLYSRGHSQSLLHLDSAYGFNVLNYGHLSNDVAAVYILNQPGTGVTSTSALTARDHSTNPSTIALLSAQNAQGRAGVVGTAQTATDTVNGMLGFTNGELSAAVLANGPIAFSNGHYATDINNTETISDPASGYTLVTEKTLKSNISGLEAESHSHTNKAVLDRTQQAYRTTDSTKLAGIADSAEVNVQSDWNETDNSKDAYIQNKPCLDTMASVSNLNALAGRVTTAEGEIDALQTATTGVITSSTLCSSIENSCTNVALKNGNNVFTGNNTLSGSNTIGGPSTTTTLQGTVTVPSGFTFGTSPCTQNAVNACDLLNVFDSIQRKVNKMEQALQSEINNLRDTLNHLRAATTPTVNGINFTNKTAQSVTATAVCNDGGATITNYTFSISENSNMTSPLGTYSNGDNPTYIFSDLQPAHTYYVNVQAFNLKGDVKSVGYIVTTPANKPTAGTPTVTATDPAGFSVSVPDVTTGGAANAEARVCYGVMTGSDCSSVTSYTCTGWETISAGTYSKSVTNLSQPGATYCVKTEIATNNGDSVLTLGPTQVTIPTVAPTLSTPSVTAQTSNSLTVSVPLTSTGGAAITAATLCAYTNDECTEPATPICATSVDYSTSPITGTISGLQPGTSYYVKATATNDDKTGESTMTTPATTAAAAPTIGEISVSNIAGTSFDVSVSVTTNGADLTDVTVCAYINDECTTPAGGICAATVNSSSNPITATVTGLTAGTPYYVKVTATNSVGTSTGKTTTPATTVVVKPNLGTPTVTPTSDGCTASGSIDLGGASSATVKVCEFTDNTYTTVLSCGTETTVTDPATSYNAALTGLDPHTTHYVAVVASNTAGNDTAAKQPLTTDYAKPTLNETVTATPATTSISVTGSVTSLGGATSTDVKVCAYTTSDYSDTPTCGSNQNLTAAGDFSVSVDGLTKGTTYYLAVVSDNGHKTDTVKTTATTLNTTLTLTSNPASATVGLCGADSVTVTYTATVENGTATSYTWSVDNGTATSTTTPTYTVTYSVTGSHTVSCTAVGAGVSDTKTVSITTGGTAATLGLCEDCNAGSITMKKGNCTSLTWENNADATKTGTLSSVTEGMVVLTENATNSPAGVYTFTGTNSDGCTVTRTATLGNFVAHPCTVTSKNGNEMGSTTTTIDSVKDHQDNWYRVVQIGSQCWLAENMRCTTSPKERLNAGGSTTSYYNAYYYNYSDATQFSLRERGYLYNWAGAMDSMFTSVTMPDSKDFPNRRGICPEGWHIPTNAEWDTLAINAGCTNSYNSGTGLGKLTGGCDWTNYGSGTSSYPGNYSYSERNSSGFSALPAGACNGSVFYLASTRASFWSANSRDSDYSLYRFFYYNSQYVDLGGGLKYYGYSVRCLRDESVVTMGEVSKTDSTDNSLSISAEYTATKAVTSATICAYTDAACNTAAGNCAADVTVETSAITGMVTGLNANTQYYVKVTVTTAGGTASTIAGPFRTATPTLTLTSNPASGTVGLCGASSVAVTYTANLTGGTANSYSWSVSGTGATGNGSTTNTFVVSATSAANLTVTCSALDGTSATIATAPEVNTTITSDGTPATLGLCEDCNAGSITVKSGNCTSLTWVNNADHTKTATTAGTEGTVLSESSATPAGVYTVTGTNGSGCTVTRTATLGNATAHPCTVTTLNGNEMGSTSNTIDSVKDHQDNWYRVVQIGSQCWLAENMRCSTSPKGRLNPGGSTASYNKAYYYNNTNATQFSLRERGYLYNWAGALDTNDNNSIRASFTNRRGICPEGWHIPTDAEWSTLATNAGCTNSYGSGTGLGKLTGGCDWTSSSNTTAPGNFSYADRNSSGFSALPAGGSYGGFYGVGLNAFFWSATSGSGNGAYRRYLYCSYAGVYHNANFDKDYGFSVRCLRDN